MKPEIDKENLVKMSKLFVSVIILTYNQKDFVAQAIHSVLNQKTNYAFEIIIGDDCSTDGTRDICKTLATKHPEKIRLFCNEENTGLVENYFGCMHRCRGKYLMDCAGDDYWIDDDKIQRQVDFMESHSEFVMLHTNWSLRDESKKSVSTQYRKKTYIEEEQNLSKDKLIHQLLTVRNEAYLILSTSCIRLEPILTFFHAHPEYTKRTYLLEDIQVIFACLHVGKIHFENVDTIMYRHHQKGVSNRKEVLKKYAFRMNVLDLTINLMKKFKIDAKNYNSFFRQEIKEIILLSFLLKQRKYLLPIKKIRRSFSVSLSKSYDIILWSINNNFIFKSLSSTYIVYRKFKKSFYPNTK